MPRCTCLHNDGERHSCAAQGPVLRALGARPGPSPDFRSVLDVYACISHPQIKTFMSPQKPVLPSKLSCCRQGLLDWKPKLYLISPPCLTYFQVSAFSYIIPQYLMELLPLCGPPLSLVWVSAAVFTLVSLAESGVSLVPVRSTLHKAARVFLFCFLATLAKVLIF